MLCRWVGGWVGGRAWGQMMLVDVVWGQMMLVDVVCGQMMLVKWPGGK